MTETTTTTTTPTGWRQVLRPQSTPTAEGHFYTLALLPDDGTPVERPFTDKPLDEDLLAKGVEQRFNWVRREWQDSGVTEADMEMAEQAKTIAAQQVKLEAQGKVIASQAAQIATQSATIANLQTVADSVPALKKQLAMLVMANAKTAAPAVTETEAE